MTKANAEMNRLVAMVRDPSTFFIYWEVEPSTLPAAAAWLLRLTDLSTAAVVEIEVQVESGNWYVSALPGRSYEIELGWRDDKGEYRRLLTAGQRRLPPQSFSHLYDRQWMILEEDFIKLLQLCWFGFSGSSELLLSRASLATAEQAENEVAPQPSSPGVPKYTGRR